MNLQRIFIILIIVIQYTTCSTTNHNNFNGSTKLNGTRLSKFLKIVSKISVETRKYENAQIPDAKIVYPEYDFIIVGGGSAGCVLANRLSEEPTVTVLLLEAGGDESINMDVPLFASYLQLGPINWGYKTQPQESACLGLKNQRCSWPRGKVLGGSSVLNYMVYTRGNKNDYNRWKDAGNYGWGYEDVLPYFMKLEDVQVPEYRDSQIRGSGGPLTVSYAPYYTELSTSFVESGLEYGFDQIDYNGESQTGFNILQASLKNGSRLSTNRAYLMPIKNRKNLHVKKLSQVTKILINPKTKHTYGINYEINGKKYKVRSRKEVILSAGAISTPQLLMLSGIGPKYHLNSLNIPVIKNLWVGYNLQDHIVNGGLTFLINKNVSLRSIRLFEDGFDTLGEYTEFHSGPLTVPGGIEAIAFVNTKLNAEINQDYPDMELLLLGGAISSDPSLSANFGIKEEIYKTVYKPIENLDAFSIFPLLLRPKSRGRLLLKNKNPYKHPIIYHNYLTEDEDIDVLVEGTKAAIQLVASKAFEMFEPKLHDTSLPACKHLEFNTDEYWRCTIRQLTLTIYHQCCTAKMGPESDYEAVVDPELRVHGVTGLRVADASVMPFVPNGHTNAPTIMIAEKAADLIKSTWFYKK